MLDQIRNLQSEIRNSKSPRTFALVGKPNCGKTALFNQLTGSRQKVANYPGVTVERKEGQCMLPTGEECTILDLPGFYGLNAQSMDAKITRAAITGELRGVPKPDILICVADATSLRICLRLVLEIKRLGIPCLLALNFYDLAEKQGFLYDLKTFENILDIPVIPVTAIKKEGVSALTQHLGNWHPKAQTPVILHPVLLSAKSLRDLQHQVLNILERVSIRQGQSSRWTDRLDKILLHPGIGFMILLGFLFLVFQAVFTLANFPMELIDSAIVGIRNFLAHQLPEGPLKSLLLDGILAGVGSVIIFLPQILILFFFILLLEDSGYMARTAFLLDRMMGGVGLHGKAFIPLLGSFACAIPGIMATRTIPNAADRLITIMILPLMTCSARLPVYTLIIAAFIPNQRLMGGLELQGLVLFSLYTAGIVSALLVAWVLKFFFKFSNEGSFIMELPQLRRPTFKNLAWGLYERAKIFLTRAGTVILMLMIVIWFLSTFPAPPPNATEPAIYYSMTGQLGRALEVVFAPIGFNWQMTMALVPGMAAREVAVSVLSMVYALSDVGEGTLDSLKTVLASQWTLASAMAFLMWYVFAPQCLSTLAVVKRETNSWIWPTLLFLYLMGMAYGASWFTYHLLK